LGILLLSRLETSDRYLSRKRFFDAIQFYQKKQFEFPTVNNEKGESADLRGDTDTNYKKYNQQLQTLQSETLMLI
jgi:hypothetical protein